MSTHIFDSAEKKDAAISKSIEDAMEHARAHPQKNDARRNVISLYKKAIALWEACESDLRTMESSVSEYQTIVEIDKEINLAHDLAISYRDEMNAAFREMLNRTTTPSRKVSQALKESGSVMQSAGQSMMNAGHAFTTGCTVPIIILVVIVILLMLIL